MGLFRFEGDDPSQPTVPNGPSDRWDGRYINPGLVLFHQDRFHMLRNGFMNWPGVVSQGYLTSLDGRTWIEEQEAPVLTSESVPYAAPGANVSTGYVDSDGMWVIFFHTVSNTEPSRIGRAHASSPLGPWQIDPEPVLSPGPAGSWDESHLRWPSILQTEAGYVLYYTGVDSSSRTRIGRATSADGQTWTKHDDPTTAEAPFSESDPVHSPEAEWEGRGVDRPIMVLNDLDGWLMLYQGGSNLNQRGLAFSEDGISWTRHPENPILTRELLPKPGTTWDTNLVYHDGTYYWFLEIGSLVATDIYLATHEGPLAP